MARIDELNVDNFDLNIQHAALVEELKAHRDALMEHVEKVLKKNLDMNGVKLRCNLESAQVNIGSHTIDLYFHRQWTTKFRTLEMNFGCFGSFTKNDADCVKYCEVLGHFAGIMEVIEKQLLDTDIARELWKAYDDAQSAVNDVEWKISKNEDEIKMIKSDAKREAVIAKLVVGAKITVSNRWSSVTKTIDRITGKNILFAEDYGHRTKKDEVIDNLVNGRWSIA